MDTPNTELIRGHADTIILRVLEQKDRYGYEVLDIIESMSEGQYAIKQATLYSCLKRLEKQGFISSYYGDIDDETGGGRRKYYTLTQKGRDILTQDQREWEFSRSILDKLLSDKQIDLATVEPPFNAAELRPLTKRVKIYDDPIAFKQSEPQKADAAPSISATTSPEKAFNEEPKANECIIPPAPNPIWASGQSQTALLDENKEPSPEAIAQAEARARAAAVLYADAAPSFASKRADPAKEVNLFPDIVGQDKPQSADNGLVEAIRPMLTLEQQLAEQRLYASVAPQNASEIQTVKNEPSAFNKVFSNVGDPIVSAVVKDTAPKETASAENPAAPYNPYSHEVNYRTALGSLYGGEAPSPTASPDKERILEDKEAALIDAANSGKAKQFNDLKQTLYNEGYKLKTYSKAASTNYYSMNYILSNKIKRDSVLLTFCVLVAELLLLFIGRKVFGYSGLTLLIIGAVTALIPIGVTLMCALNPTKRTKAAFNFRSSLSVSLVLYLIAMLPVTIVFLASPGLDFTFADGKAYVPYILSSNLVVAVLIYDLLYKSKKYVI